MYPKFYSKITTTATHISNKRAGEKGRVFIKDSNGYLHVAGQELIFSSDSASVRKPFKSCLQQVQLTGQGV